MCNDLVDLITHVKSGLSALAEKHGLTSMQLYVLNSIQRGEITMGRIAGDLHCDASNVTGIIDRLVAQGLVTRKESEQDRRTKVLHLTTKGQKIVDDVASEMPEALGCNKISATEQTTMHDLITRLV